MSEKSQAVYLLDTYRVLKGARVKDVSVTYMEGEPTLSLTFVLKSKAEIRANVWQDEEGNGPGCLAFVNYDEKGTV